MENQQRNGLDTTPSWFSSLHVSSQSTAKRYYLEFGLLASLETANSCAKKRTAKERFCCRKISRGRNDWPFGRMAQAVLRTFPRFSPPETKQRDSRKQTVTGSRDRSSPSEECVSFPQSLAAALDVPTDLSQVVPILRPRSA